MKLGYPARAGRRLLLQLGVAGAAGLLSGRLSAAQAPENMAPQPGDLLSVEEGAMRGRPLTLADLPPGGPPLHVWPLTPDTRVLRNGSPRNAIIVVLGGSAAAEPVAYSSLCTHEGCSVDVWLPEDQRLFCPCHSSEFDPFDGGAVNGGPAERGLPRLPLRVTDDGLLEVAAGFIGRVYRDRRRR